MKKEGMISDKLKKAREYEEKFCKTIPPEQKPSFHVSSPVGWINDPNGFSLYQGEYHLFYQHYPYGIHWGPMHWGHSKTRDFIVWEQLPVALAPDEAYDKDGCFSGGAIEYNGEHILMYTSVKEIEDGDGIKCIRQNQSIAVGNGTDYEKYDINPVITADLLPEGSSLIDFRDPKLWREGDTFYALIGSRSQDESGQLALFSSKDLKAWNYETILDSCKKEYGLMWECPDFFILDKTTVILTSPQDMEAKELEFHGGNGTIYITGSYNKDKLEFKREHIGAIDYGLDFYAPQTLESADGRRIMIGWLQSWDNHIVYNNFKWSGMMSIPRELQIKNGRLYQNPIRELQNYYQNEVSYKKEVLKAGVLKKFEGIKGRQLDMTVEITMEQDAEFRVRLAADEKHFTEITYSGKRNVVAIDRTYCGIRRDVISRREFKASLKSDKIKFRILVDKYSVEVFVNEGEQAASMLIGTPLEAEDILFLTDSLVTLNICKYDITVN